MAVLNSNILSRAWLSGSNMFQQRIPNPVINQYGAVIQALFSPLNNDLYNEFSELLNGLNATYVDIKRWDSQFKQLKKADSLDWSHAERHVAIKYLQAHAGRWDDQTLLKVERPEFVEWFYSVTEPRRYEFSWSKQQMAMAFARDGYGYDDLLSGTITQMLNSADVDEMNIMLQMFAEADNRFDGGIYRYHLDAMPDDEASAKALLKAVRATAGRMRVAPTMMYNHIPVPVVEDGSTLVFWCTPEVSASVDVDALAAAFNIDRANIQYKKIEIPEFPIPNVVAALTSEDFIYYRDYAPGTGLEPPFYNPGNKTWKYYYWAQAMIGCNPAANAVLFTLDEGTSVPTITVAPTGLSFTPNSVEIEPGGTAQLKLELAGTVTGDDTLKAPIAVEPDAAIFSVTGTRTTGEGNAQTTVAIDLNTRTYVDAYGILHLQKTGVEAGDVLTISAGSLYTNTSGATTTYTATATATVVAPTPQGAKECAVAENPYIEYTDANEDVTASE